MIKNLNVSGWFGNWFKHENEKQIKAQVYVEKVELNLNLPAVATKETADINFLENIKRQTRIVCKLQ